jgi:hypothetical protein
MCQTAMHRVLAAIACCQCSTCAKAVAVAVVTCIIVRMYQKL